MVDTTTTLGPGVRRKASLLALDPRTRRRNAAETRFKVYGVVAILIGLAFLVALLWAILSNGIGAFSQTFITVPITLDQATIDAAEKSVVKTSKYKEMIDAGLGRAIPRIHD